MNISCSIDAQKDLINIYNIYNFLSISHNKILKKKSFFALKQTLRMQNRNIIMNNFNLYYLI